jgi:hypothetical protein
MEILREEQAEYGQAIVVTVSRHSHENKSAPLKKVSAENEEYHRWEKEVSFVLKRRNLLLQT